MPTANQATSAAGIAEAVQDRDVRDVGIAVAGGVGGLFLAQELTDQVLPMLDMSMDPSTPTELGASAAMKLVGAVLFVALASRAGGRSMMALSGSVAFGMLVSMGLDLFDAVQRGGIPGNQPSMSASPSPSPKPVKASPSPSPSPSRPTPVSANGSGSGPAGQGGFR